MPGSWRMCLPQFLINKMSTWKNQSNFMKCNKCTVLQTHTRNTRIFTPIQIAMKSFAIVNKLFVLVLFRLYYFAFDFELLYIYAVSSQIGSVCWLWLIIRGLSARQLIRARCHAAARCTSFESLWKHRRCFAFDSLDFQKENKTKCEPGNTSRFLLFDLLCECVSKCKPIDKCVRRIPFGIQINRYL